jgi:hypothetical protein
MGKRDSGTGNFFSVNGNFYERTGNFLRPNRELAGASDLAAIHSLTSAVVISRALPLTINERKEIDLARNPKGDSVFAPLQREPLLEEALPAAIATASGREATCFGPAGLAMTSVGRVGKT